VTQSHIHYGVAYTYSLRKRGAKAQLQHRNMASQRHAVFGQILTINEMLSGEALRLMFMKEKGAVVADDFVRVGTRAYLFEDETGSHTIQEMVNKASAYQKKYSDLQQILNAPQLRVVFNLRIWRQVEFLVAALRELPSKEAFWVCHHGSTFDPRHASYLLKIPLFYCPAFPEPVKLLEDM
jgi:hypothetical protein